MITFRRKQRPLRTMLAIAGARSVGVTIMLAVGFVAASATSTPLPAPDLPTTESVDSANRLMAEYRCSTTPLRADPASALVRRDGRVEHVSFDEAFAIVAGQQPGSLVAVCRAPVAAG